MEKKREGRMIEDDDDDDGCKGGRRWRTKRRVGGEEGNEGKARNG